MASMELFKRVFKLGLLIAVMGLAFGCAELAEAKSKRAKVIDFEDEVVEGINKRPLDSLSQLSEKNKKKKKPHLYRKRAGFKPETTESLGELRYIQ